MARIVENSEKFIGIIYNRADNIYQEFRICDREEFVRKVIAFTIDNKKIEGRIIDATIETESVFDPMSYFGSYDPVLKVKIEFTKSESLDFMLSEYVSAYYYFDIIPERAYVDQLL